MLKFIDKTIENIKNIHFCSEDVLVEKKHHKGDFGIPMYTEFVYKCNKCNKTHSINK